MPDRSPGERRGPGVPGALRRCAPTQHARPSPRNAAGSTPDPQASLVQPPGWPTLLPAVSELPAGRTEYVGGHETDATRERHHGPSPTAPPPNPDRGG